MIPFCPEAASCVILRKNRDDHYQQLLVKRSVEDGGYWSHVGGGVEPGETAVDTIKREILEETGLVPDALYNGEYIEQFYQVDKNRILVMPVFVAILEQERPVILNDEHTDFCWCTLDEAKKKVPFHGQRTLYDHVWTLFATDSPIYSQQIL
jgi:dATP pyrophosphohydrolase